MLISMITLKIDIIGQAKHLLGENTKFAITEPIRKELSIVPKNNPKLKKAVIIAKEAIKNNNFDIIDTESQKADDSLVELSKKDYFIATNDKEVRKKIKEENGKLLILRNKKYLIIENE